MFNDLLVNNIESNLNSCSLVKKTFDFFEMEILISSKLRASDLDISSFFKILSMQLVNTKAKSLNIEECDFNAFHCDRTVCNFLSNKTIDDSFIKEVLKDISVYNEQKLILDVSSHLLKRLNIKTESVYIDFSLCDISDNYLKIRDSKYNSSPVPSFVQIQLIETTSNIPIFTKIVAENIKNRALAFSHIIKDIPLILEYFPDLKYLIADSSMLNRETFKAVNNLNIFLISKLKTPYRKPLLKEEEIELYKELPTCSNVYYRFIDDIRLNGGNVRMLSLIDKRKKKEYYLKSIQSIDKARRQFRHLCEKSYLNTTYNLSNKDKVLEDMKKDLLVKSPYLKLDNIDLKEDNNSFKILGYKTIINRRKLNREVSLIDSFFDVVTTDFNEENIEKNINLFLSKGYSYRIWLVKNIKHIFVPSIYIKDFKSINSFMAILSINYIIFHVINKILHDMEDTLEQDVGKTIFDKNYKQLLDFDSLTLFLDKKIINRNIKEKNLVKILECFFETLLKYKTKKK